MVSSIASCAKSHYAFNNRRVHPLQALLNAFVSMLVCRKIESLVDYADPQACREEAALSSACGGQEVVQIFQGQLIGLQPPVRSMYTSIRREGRMDGMYGGPLLSVLSTS